MRKKRADYQAANSVHTLFRELPKAVIQRLGRRMRKLAPSLGLTYVDDKGKTASITTTLRPRLLAARIRKALWQTTRILDGAFLKIAPLYFQDAPLATLFPFSGSELRWISFLRQSGYRPGRIVSRWDANTTFALEDWKHGYSIFEVNGVGVGGLWYGPACAELALRTVVPELRKIDPTLRPFLDQDMRSLLLGVLLAQRKKLGRTRGVMALAMEKASGSNYIEFERLARLFTKRGYPSIVTEPTEFRLKDGEILARGKKIDILYRDTTLSELCLLEEKGHDLSALREAFRRGQAVSSLEGEFDHKSALEAFTNPDHAHYFTSKERAIFKRHILWTRLLIERRTIDPRGKQVDLIPYVTRHQSQLVLKPNRLYGGKGVVFGNEVSRHVWEQKIQVALRERGDWVIQKAGELRVKRFFRPDEKGVKERELYVVSGLFATEKGLGVVGRMSERTVVNVARRGGLTPILIIR